MEADLPLYYFSAWTASGDVRGLPPNYRRERLSDRRHHCVDSVDSIDNYQSINNTDADYTIYGGDDYNHCVITTTIGLETTLERYRGNN